MTFRDSMLPTLLHCDSMSLVIVAGCDVIGLLRDGGLGLSVKLID
jgi:hypothetical protein